MGNCASQDPNEFTGTMTIPQDWLISCKRNKKWCTKFITGLVHRNMDGQLYLGDAGKLRSDQIDEINQECKNKGEPKVVKNCIDSRQRALRIEQLVNHIGEMPEPGLSKTTVYTIEVGSVFFILVMLLLFMCWCYCFNGRCCCCFSCGNNRCCNFCCYGDTKKCSGQGHGKNAKSRSSGGPKGRKSFKAKNQKTTGKSKSSSTKSKKNARQSKKQQTNL